MRKAILIVAFLALLVVGFSGYYWLKPKALPIIKNISQENNNSIEYVNKEYGFKVTLPVSWKGYKVETNSWEGNDSNEKGPLISIQNPKSTTENPYQDIPIMVFTPNQWDEMLRDKFHVGAAPINPSRLTYNNDYVFALPARYNYAFPTGWEEVEKILQNNVVQPLNSINNVSDNTKILVCGGIPNGSTLETKTGTKLFINLPKDIYPNKHLQFRNENGNATAGWVSDTGPFGESYHTTADCWSYYYELNGSGKLELSAKSDIPGHTDYLVHLVITK
jgi:hypothetical protein